MSEREEPSYSLICELIYVGDRNLARDLDLMKQLGITHVVNATTEIRNYFEHLPQFEYFKCPVLDSDAADLSPFFDDVCQFVEKALQHGHGVLVHCQQGVSRSVTLVIAYLIKKKAMSLPEAYNLLRQKRAQAKPRPNFLKQLVGFEKRVRNPHARSRAAGPAPAPAHAPASAPAVAMAVGPSLRGPCGPPAGPSAPTAATAVAPATSVTHHVSTALAESKTVAGASAMSSLSRSLALSNDSLPEGEEQSPSLSAPQPELSSAAAPAGAQPPPHKLARSEHQSDAPEARAAGVCIDPAECPSSLGRNTAAVDARTITESTLPRSSDDMPPSTPADAFAAGTGPSPRTERSSLQVDADRDSEKGNKNLKRKRANALGPELPPHLR